jgi:putative flippase GtrA
MKFCKKDLLFSIITGLTTGIIVWRIFLFLDIMPEYQQYFMHAVWIVPVLWIIGVNLGYFLGRFIGFFNQFGRFTAVGFTNAAVDFGILNFLISWSGEAGGPMYSVFKAISFFVAFLHSYYWNKIWVFEAGQSGGGSREFGKFLGVAIMSILVNVGVASLVVAVAPSSPETANVWANLGAIAGSASALVFSFVGFRLLVFVTKK